MNIRILLVPTLLAVLIGCGDTGHSHGPGDGHDHDKEPAPQKTAGTDDHGHDHNHDHGQAIVLPAQVQKNLGITWATAEYRVVQGVVRMPGRFEAEPNAQRPYHAPLDGRVSILVQPYQTVSAGTPLYRLQAPAWQELQRELTESQAASEAAEGRLAAAQAHVEALEQALQLWENRVEQLTRVDRELGGKAAERADAAGRVADLRVGLTEARQSTVEAGREARDRSGTPGSGLAARRVALLLERAARLSGLSVAELTAIADGHPRWATLAELTITAQNAGTVESAVLADGAWINATTVVVTVTDPRGVRLRASGLQADLPRLHEGLPARIVASDPSVRASLDADLLISPIADPNDRSVDLVARARDNNALPSWVRPGVTASLEVIIDGSSDEELAIPLAATIRDGLETVYFRRKRNNPDEVEKVSADLGASDGRWIAVLSGLKEGDQVVVGGIYPLKLSQQSGGQKAGHFHSDGTFHDGKH